MAQGVVTPDLGLVVSAAQPLSRRLRCRRQVAASCAAVPVAMSIGAPSAAAFARGAGVELSSAATALQRHLALLRGAPVVGSSVSAASSRPADSTVARQEHGSIVGSTGGSTFAMGLACALLRKRRNGNRSAESDVPFTYGLRIRRCAAAAKASEIAKAGNFVEDIVVKDLEQGTYTGRVHTRFPPEPNGYLHIGHAKSICLNFGISNKFDGKCNLRFDDTNPASEKQEYIDAIKEDVKWLGFEWSGDEHYASDYFGQLHEWAIAFIERGWAYVDELSAEEISEYRGSVTQPGKDSPYRDRSIKENLELFKKMQSGELDEGACVLRAKIDMEQNNVIMRDPIMYRILKAPHPRTGTTWHIYPAYDWAHGLSDALENITHSVCTLEFNMHNELYDWFNERVKEVGTLDCDVLPKQHEFARLEMTHIVVSKRKLKKLVDGGHVDGWDDPRLPTISGMRRRGYPASALRRLCDLIGVSKVDTTVILYDLLETCVRDAVEEATSAKLLCVLKPLRVIVTNWEGEDEVIEVPADADGLPVRKLPFGKELLIESDDFMEVPEKGFKRLVPGGTVKLRYGYTLTCDEVVKGDDGKVSELRCTYDSESLGKRPPKKVGVVHWAHATASVPINVRLYDRLFAEPRPEERDDYLEALNPKSLEDIPVARCEPCVTELVASSASSSEPLRAQFERCGYFILDAKATEVAVADDSSTSAIVFNRTAALVDTWKKPEEKKLTREEQRAAAKAKKEAQKQKQKDKAAAAKT